MRTLFISHTYLDGNGGGVFASRTHINLFARVSTSMTLIYPCKQGRLAEHIDQKRIEMVPVEDHRSKIHKFFDLCCGKVHRFKLDKLFFSSKRFDVVVFDNSVVSSGLIKSFKKASIKVITIHHNYQIEYVLGDSPLITLIPNLFWTWIYERQSVKYSDVNITLTGQDVELLRTHYDKKAPFAVLGVFEYERSVAQRLTRSERGCRYVITGGLHNKQTEKSLMRWIQRYYPILKQQDPDAFLQIAGGGPSAALSNAIRKAGIDLVDSPSDMTPILQSADYYICPVDLGGGLKLRNLDGLKFGLPVLTHKVSLRGYEKMEEAGVMFSYHDPSEFAIGLRKMKAIRIDREEIQHIYMEHYNFDAGLARLKEILSESQILM